MESLIGALGRARRGRGSAYLQLSRRMGNMALQEYGINILNFADKEQLELQLGA